MSDILAPNYFGLLYGRDVISSADLSPQETLEVMRVAMGMKAVGIQKGSIQPLRGETVALIFEKQSLRTRTTFEVALAQLGAHPIYLTQADIGLGTRESVPDAARNLSRWVQGIVARTYLHSTVAGLAEHASIPVINALSDREHPCQALADFTTIVQRSGSAAGFTLAWVGDGNNVCNSVMIVGAQLGAHLRVASPAGYEPDAAVVGAARSIAMATGGSVEVMNDPYEAVQGAGAVYTDVWTSMGQEAEREERLKAFARYQVNSELMAAADPAAFALHCLPAHRGEEITDQVVDGPQSAVLDQAENRLYAQKALIAMTMARKS